MTGNRPIEDMYPLSPMQQGMLFHTLRAAESGMYLTQLSCELAGDLDTVALARAWDQVVERHAVLRSAFVWERLDDPFQVVYRQVKLPWVEEDWRDFSPDEQTHRIEEFLAADRAQGFEPGKAPLMRLALIRTGEQTYRFLWSHHHLLLDGWSLAQLLREVFVAYDALVRGLPLDLPSGRPYRDFITWLQSRDLSAAEAFWRRCLAGFTAPTPLGVDRSVDSKAILKEASRQRLARLPGPLTAELEILARRQQVTVNTLVQAAWAVLLSRYSGEEDLVFGITTAGRPADFAGIEAMVGLFINTLPLRVRVAPDEELSRWVRWVQERQLELRQYEHSPLVEVQRWSEIPSGLPLFESTLVFENYPVHDSLLRSEASLRLGGVIISECISFPLSIVVMPAGEELGFRVLYDPHRLEDSAVDRLLRHLRHVLEGFVEHPCRRLRDVPILVEVERAALLREWNDTTDARPGGEHLLQDLIASQSQHSPDAIAGLCGAEHLSYGELERRSNKLARRLRATGVGPESRVGICLERTPELLIGLLATLKAGGAFMPLEASYPRERLAFIVEDSQARLLLTQELLLDVLPSSGGEGAAKEVIPVIRLDTDWGSVAAEPDMPLEGLASPANLAYVIYTSGSTGRPKGVMISHRGFANYLHWALEKYAPLLGYGAPVHSPIGFDLTLTSLFLPLLAGRTAVLIRSSETRELAEALRNTGGFSLVKLTPAHLEIAHQHLAPRDLAESTQLLVIGGETLQGQALLPWLEHAVGTRLINEYGPTETVVGCSYFEVSAADPPPGPVPIGSPIANIRLHVLGKGGELLPLGVVGELTIAGAGLARGYWGRPAATATAFVPDPLAEKPGARLYRTGDLARRLPEGSLEFVGRIDRQVKVRGFRIELEEIESLLASQPSVREAVVLLRETSGDKHLVGYIVPTSGADRSALPRELREFLKRVLPEYMVPTDLVMLDALPLTPNGKVDRLALPAPESPGRGEGFVAPRTAVEEVLAGIWCEVLGRTEIGIFENFFDLGGHSMHAVRLVARVRRTFQVELLPPDLLDEPTIAGLAKRIDGVRRTGTCLEAPPIKPVDRDRDPPLSFAQQRLWLAEHLEPDASAYLVPSALRLSGPLSVPALERTLAEIVRRHEVLRTSFPAVEGIPVQRISPPSPPVLPLVDLRGLPAPRREAEILRLAMEELRRPFDLTQAPLFRIHLLRLALDEHVALLTTHHIITDAWSSSVLAREVGALYDAFLLGRPSPLADLPVQYADFAVWQRQWLQGDVLEEHLAYWRQHLAGELPVFELSCAKPRPETSGVRGAYRSFLLTSGLAAQLRALGRREGATLFMVLLAAFKTLLFRQSGQTDLVVGTATAGRSRVEVEDLIGFFINMLPIRTDGSGNPKFRELLARVRQSALGAYAHQDLPLEKLVQELRPERTLNQTPLFRVAFSLDNVPRQTLRLRDLTLVPLDLAREAVRFDLTVWVRERDEGLSVDWTYRTDVFQDADVAALHDRFEALLADIVARPEARLSTLEILTELEREQRLQEAYERQLAKSSRLVRGLRRQPILSRASSETPERATD